jgi:mRNA interferase RelE/StbE
MFERQWLHFGRRPIFVGIEQFAGGVSGLMDVPAQHFGAHAERVARLRILALVTLIAASSAFLGVLAGQNVIAAVVAMGIVALGGGVWRHLSADYGPGMAVSSALFSRDFDADFFKLPPDMRVRIESSIDRLGMTLASSPHHRMKGVEAYRIRVGDYRVIYNFDRSKGILYLLSVGHKRKVYRR